MHSTLAVLGSLSILMGGASVAFGQDFNVDFGTFGDAPGSSYGGAGQVGYWNDIGVLTTSHIPLRGLNGQLTPVSIYGIGGTQMLSFDHPMSTGNDDALIDDMLIGFNSPVDVCVWIQNLENGYYEVTNYALTPNDDELLSRVRVDFANEGPIYVGGEWTGAHVDGVSFTRHHVYVTENEIAFHSGEWGGEVQSGLNGVQIRLLSPASTPLPSRESFGLRIDSIVPNPGIGSQTIQFSLTQPSEHLRLEVLDPAGRMICARVFGYHEAGPHAWEWDGLDRAGRSVPPSVYFVRVTDRLESVSRALIRIR